MVAHLFAHQSQEHAQGSNFYFNGDTCYSYGPHYVAAVHHGDCVLINSNSYSMTTARHLSHLRYACNHLGRYYVPNPAARTKAEHRENFRALVAEYEREILRLSRARKYTSLETSERMLANANEYAARFKIGNRLQPIDTSEIQERIKTREARESAARKRARKAAEKRERERLESMRAEYVENLAEWREGKRGLYGLGEYRHHDAARLRLTDDGRVQTSHGAEFPASDARQHIGFVLACFDQGRNWQRNGENIPLGPFQLDRIDGKAGTLRAGCHTVTVNEVKRLAAQLRAE
jgi:hypothetical protein